MYPIEDTGRSRRPYDSAASPYDFSRMQGPFDSVSADAPSIEQIIQQGYFAVPISDPVTAMITDKQQTSRLGLDDVIGQIRQRYEIYEQNVYQIELAKCAAINAIYHHEAYCGPGSANSRQHYAKHKAIQDLYEQQRTERTTLWKDVSQLRTALPESAQQYLTAHRKVSVLAQDRGDVS